MFDTENKDFTFRQDTLKLRLRLISCLQTILGLEPEVRRLCPEGFLSREFEAIRSFMAVAEEMRLEEAEVQRIESATRVFLDEFIAPLLGSSLKQVGSTRFIQ